MLGEFFLIFIVSWIFLIPMGAITLLFYGGIKEYKTVNKTVNKNVRRNISLDNECIEKIKPYVEENKGNFSAAIRNIIKASTDKNGLNGANNIDNSLLRWILNEIDGRFLPNSIIGRYMAVHIENVKDIIEKDFNDNGWNVDIDLKYNKGSSNEIENVVIKIGSGEKLENYIDYCSDEKIRFVASLISQILVKSSIEKKNPLVISSVIDSDNYTKIELLNGDEEDAIDTLKKFFGDTNDTIKTIKEELTFWKSIINNHASSDYNMVTIHRNDLEDLLSGKLFIGEIDIEILAKKPISDINLEELLVLIKQVYENSRIFDRIEISGNDLILFHNYRNKDAVDKLKNGIITLLHTGGYVYNAKSTASMIILTYMDSTDNLIDTERVIANEMNEIWQR